MAKSKHCVGTAGLHRTSCITGRDIIVSEYFDRVVVPEEIETEAVSRATERIATYWDEKVTQATTATGYWRGDYFQWCRTIRNVRDRNDLIETIDELVDLYGRGGKKTGEKKGCQIILTQLWSHGLASVPISVTGEGKTTIEVSVDTVGKCLKWIEEVTGVLGLKGEVERKRAGGLVLRLARGSIGVNEIGDLTPGTTSETSRKGLGARGSGVVKALVTAQRTRYVLRPV